MRALLVALLVVLPALPAASAHALVSAADPLSLNIDGWLTADGRITPEGPAAGSVYFASYQPGSAGTPLTFTMTAPVRFLPQGLDVTIYLRADKPVVTQDNNGKSFHVELLAGGAPIPGAAMDVAIAQQALKPTDTAGVSPFTLPTPTTTPIDENATVTLRLTPLMPALLDGALAIVVGADTGSSANFPLAQVPSVKDLKLQDTDLFEYDLAKENFSAPDPAQAVNEMDVYHDNVTTNYVTVIGTKAYLVLKGAETSGEAQSYHDFPDHAKRIAATHDFMVGGTLMRVHPGVGVVLDMDLSKGPIDFRCVKNCPAVSVNMTIYPNRSLQAPGQMGQPIGGPTATGSPAAPTAASTQAAAPTPERRAPGPGLAPLLVAGAALALVRRRAP